MKKIILFIIIILLIVFGGWFYKKSINQNTEKILGYPQDYRKNNSSPSASRDYYYKIGNIVYYHYNKRVTECIGCSEIAAHDVELENSDAKSFIIIDSNYAKDKNNVYYWGTIIEDADPETFQPLDWPNAKDKNYYFSENDITGPVEH